MNLLSKLHKNSILTGPVESYCLACGCLLQSEEESYEHISNLEHVENLRTLTHLEKYTDDCILKSKEGYYCPYCNIILPTIKRVSLHVTDPKHIDSKNSQSITRHAGVIFALDSVVIDPRSWHGLDGSTCSVCDQDYADEEYHKKEGTHILNLIQADCQFGENFIYRKVDEDLFFCLICNDILPVPEKSTHHESERHLQLYEKSKNEGIAVINQTLAAIEPNKNKVASINDKAITPNPVEKDLEEDKDTREKTPENKTQNGSSNIINDNRTRTQKNTHCSNKLNTESEHRQESQSDSQSKPQEVTIIKTHENKLNSQNNSTQEAGVNFEKKSQVLRLNTPIETQDTAQQNTAKVSQEANTHELKDKSKSLNTKTEAKATETNKSEIVSSKVQTEKSEPYLYEFLKARNFIIRAHNGAAFCTLCDIGVNENVVGIHNLEKHHSILFAKHVARKKLSEKILHGQDSNKNKESETSRKSKVNTVIGKENAVPVIEQTSTEAQKNTDKPADKVSTEVVGKDSKTTDKTVVESANNTQIKDKDSKISAVVEQANTTQNKAQDSKQNKENTVPENHAQSSISVGKTHEETQKSKPEQMDTAQSKRAIKKAQKRAAKAKTAKTEILPQAGIDSRISSEDSGNRIYTAREVPKSHTEDSTTTLIDESKRDDKVQINGHSKNDTEKVTDTDSKKDTQVHGLITSHADLKTEKILKLLKSVSLVDFPSAPDDIVLNSKFVLGTLSFVLIVRIDLEAQCVACDEELTLDKIQKHICMDSHRRNVEECLVVTSLDDEFIRQVKNQKYHCGFCNIILPNWEDMELHLQTYRHCDAKTSASWRLERYSSLLKHCQTKEEYLLTFMGFKNDIISG